MKKVKYFSKSKERELLQIENVLTINVSRSKKLLSKDIKIYSFEQLQELVPNISYEDFNAFSKAGWVFAKAADETREEYLEKRSIEDRKNIKEIYLDKNGCLKISTDKLIIQFVENIAEESISDILLSHNLSIIRKFNFSPNFIQVRIPFGTDINSLSGILSENEKIISAEPEFLEHIPSRFTPTDPDYTNQWQWNNDGTASACVGAGVAGADISAEAAWDLSRGQNITIAVIDNGFDIAHPDLSPALTPQSGFFQNDGSDDIFIQGTPNTYPDNDHGTFCAGMALARANNGSNGCGAANLANFTAIACLNDQVGSQTTLARAIAYAADPRTEVDSENRYNGADIISCSLGPNVADWAMTDILEAAIEFAVNSAGRGRLGTSIFWAVTNGNFTINGSDGTDEVVSHPDVIAVGRSTNNDVHNNTGFGPELDFLAPGVNVRSTGSGGGSRCDTGTSFAAPCAAGVGALVLSIAPQLFWRDLRDLLRDTCDRIGGVNYGSDNQHPRYGYGRINALAAVQQAVNLNYDDDQLVTVLAESNTGLNLIFRDNSNGRVFTRDEFVELINRGEYPSYEVVQMGEYSIPKSRPNLTTEDNLG